MAELFEDLLHFLGPDKRPGILIVDTDELLDRFDQLWHTFEHATQIPLSCLAFEETKITFPSPKGGEEKAFSIPMPTVLMPLLVKLKAERKSSTLDFPFQPSRRWQQFFIKLKLTHLCFHCLRVTYINRLRRAGVPREAAMRLVNHASALVHEVYQREKVDDVMQWRDAVKFPISKNSLVLAA